MARSDPYWRHVMQWEGREESQNVEDERGGGGGFGGKTGLAVGGGIGGLILIVVLSLIFGVDVRQFFGGGGGPGVVQPNAGPTDPEDDKLKHFSSIVFRDTEIVWDKQFKEMGKTYKKPILHLYSDRV